MLSKVTRLFKVRQADVPRNDMERDYRAVFQTAAGRRVLADILNRAGLEPLAVQQDQSMKEYGALLLVQEGRRYLAHKIFLLAGGKTSELAEAVVANNLERAMKYER